MKVLFILIFSYPHLTKLLAIPEIGHIFSPLIEYEKITIVVLNTFDFLPEGLFSSAPWISGQTFSGSVFPILGLSLGQPSRLYRSH